MLILVEIGAFMLVVSLLNLLNHFISYLSSWLLPCYLLMVSLRINSCFYMSWHNG
jgi:hypothetical protein